MNRAVMFGLRLLLVVIVLGCVLAQVWLFPSWASVAATAYPEVGWLRWPVLVMVLVGIAAVEIALAAVWVLLAMTQDERVFSPRAFRWVDVIVAAALVGVGLALALAVLLRYAEVTPPALGLLLLALIVAGVAFALLMVVMKDLLRKATRLTAELNEVI